MGVRNLVEFVFGASVVLGCPIAGICLAAWVLRPVDRAARLRQAPAQFTLADVLCLFFLAALPTGCLRWMAGGMAEDGVGCFTVFAWTACGLLWWTAVQTLSRAGITHTGHRAALLTLVVPTTLLGAVMIPVLTLLIVSDSGGGRVFPSAVSLGLAILADLAACAAAYGCGRYVRWLLAHRAGGALVGGSPPAAQGEAGVEDGNPPPA